MSNLFKWVLLTLAAIMMLSASVAADESLKIKHEQFTLPNGLNVILYEDHTIPMVAVNVWYHVGSKNEVFGRTGFAHLFEHMMFQGSPHFEGEYFAPLQEIGGQVNGSTNQDRTNYWENVPSNYLELPLAMESDRMANLPEAMTQEGLETQIDVVSNERRQGVDNAPYGIADEVMKELMFPEGHPYSWTVIGSLEDLSNSTLDDVIDFFKSYYTPNNASLCVAGDIDLAEARTLIEKYFAPIPPGPPITRKEYWIPSLDGVKRASAEDDVPVPRVYMSWHTPPYYAPGDGEFDIFANILSNGKTSRLYQALVYEQQIAQRVYAYQESHEIGSLFMIVATAKPGHTAEELEAAIDAELSKILADGFTEAELSEAKNSLEAGFIRGLQNVGGFGGMADILNQYSVFVGSPDSFAWDLERWTKPSVDEVMAYARQYINLSERAILYVVPQGTLTVTDNGLDRSETFEAKAEPDFTPPAIQSATLDNGLKILLVKDHRLPLVDLQLVIKRGMTAEPVGQFGLASVTADLMNEGTTSRTALEISQQAKALGINLGSGASADATTLSLNALKKSLDDGLELMADVLLNPTFPDEELDRLKKQYLATIQQQAKQPTAAGNKLFYSLLYGANHPYGQPPGGTGTEASLAAITRDDIVAFYKNNYIPNVSAIVISGDMTMDEARQRVSTAFGKWKEGTVAELSLPAIPERNETEIFFVDKPGAEQTYIMAGNIGLRSSNDDRYAAQMLNRALGGMFTSRINLNLREDKGYTYGARSRFVNRIEPGPFYASSRVIAESTADALNELVKELVEIRTDRPLTLEEIEFTRSGMIKGFPQAFQNISGMTRQLASIFVHDRPLDSWEKYVSKQAGITSEMLNDAAHKYIHADKLLLVVVGDRSQIEEEIKALNLGKIMN